MAAWDWLRSLKRRNPTMFAHWTLGSAAGWEPCEARVSRTVLRERGAAMLRATHLLEGLWVAGGGADWDRQVADLL